jgi:hypothetical protein
MAILSDQDMGGGLHVIAEDTGNVVVEIRSFLGRTNFRTVTNVPALVEALQVARTVARMASDG